MKKKVKRRLNKKALLVILLTLYLIIMTFYMIFNMRIKNIIIKGASMLSDEEIIEAANIQNYPKIFTTKSNTIVKNVKKLSAINDVNVKKSINGTLTINVKEARVLFYNILTNKYVLDNKKEVDSVSNTLGVPVLVNYVTSDIYKILVEKLSKIDDDVISLISEIEYAQDVKDEVIIDANRFLLRMNDGNYIYINFAYFENLNRYKKIYTVLDDKKGVLNFDSVYNSSDNFVFKAFDVGVPLEIEEPNVLEEPIIPPEEVTNEELPA